jgi:hypothetical protein
VAELLGAACDHKYGQGCEEGVSSCCQLDGDCQNVCGQTLDPVEKNQGIKWLVAEYRNESQRMVTKG